MPTIPFIGPSYQLRSINFDAQRSVNLYPVKSETGDSKSVAGLQGTPGLVEFTELPTFPMRQEINANGRGFAVSGNTFYEIFSDGTYTNYGVISNATGLISMAYNADQVCVVNGPDGYIFTLSTNTFQQIISEGWRGSTTVTYLDGYFVFNDPDTGIYYISSLNDGTMEDPLDFASAEGSPDNLIGVMAVHKELWLFGTNSIEVDFDSGAPDFPFQRIQGAYIDYGCVAAGSIARTANTVFWLGQDDYGHGVVWMATGYQPQRVSTYAVEYAIQQYAVLSDAIAYTYQEDGHYFYVLNFTNANTTWVYDIGQSFWHERAYLGETGEYERHRGNCHMFIFGMHLIGDYENGKIYRQSLDIYDDDGNPKRWMRTSPHISDDLEYLYFRSFQLDMQTGIGLSGDVGTEDSNPQIALKWSDDGSHTYSNEHYVSAGRIGAYAVRALWRRLGRSRDRIWCATSSAAVQTFLIAGHADVEKGSN